MIQYGEREVKGVELGLVGSVTDKWQITAGLTRQDTEVTEGSIPSTGGPSAQTGSIINFSPKLSATTVDDVSHPAGTASRSAAVRGTSRRPRAP